jgi:hypothetical protein
MFKSLKSFQIAALAVGLSFSAALFLAIKYLDQTAHGDAATMQMVLSAMAGVLPLGIFAIVFQQVRSDLKQKTVRSNSRRAASALRPETMRHSTIQLSVRRTETANLFD